MESHYQTKKGGDHTIGNGRRTKFWVHKWLDCKELIPQMIREVPNDHKNRWFLSIGAMKWDGIGNNSQTIYPMECLSELPCFNSFKKRCEAISREWLVPRVYSL